MIRFIDGFDSYATSDILRRYNLADPNWQIVAGGGRFGSGAIQVASPSNTDLTKYMSTPQSAWITGFALSYNTNGYASTTIIARWGISSYQDQLQLAVSATGKLVIQKAGVALATGTTSLLSNTFYFVEWLATFNSSAPSNSNVVRLNGVVEATVPAGTNTDPQSTGTASAFSFSVDNLHWTKTFDDLYILDTTGAINNAFLGDMRIEALYPTGPGNDTTFAPTGQTANWHCVSDHPEDGDTSYVASGTPGQVDTYALSTLSTTPAVVAGVQVSLTIRKDDAGTRQAAAVVRTGNANYVGLAGGVPDSYLVQSTVFETNPSSSNPWVAADIAALEAGVKLVS